MVNQIAPASIVFVNEELTSGVRAAIERQLFITETITGTEFDARVTSTPSYTDIVHANGLRILVIRPANDYTNRDKADLVLYCKAGLASVQKNSYGPPSQTFPINSMYLSQIYWTK